MKLLPQDPQQHLRFQRTLMAAACYLLWVGLGAYLYTQDLIQVDGTYFGAYALLMIVTNVILLAVIRLGINQRLKDPSMTAIQIVIAVSWAMVLVGTAEPAARGALLVLFFSAFFFGVFRLKTRQFLGVAAYASALYGALILYEADRLMPQEVRLEIVQWVVLSVVLVWMSLMGGYVARLRARLRAANRTDSLTGARSRRAITDELERAVELARSGDRPVSIVLMDLDRFKPVNDQYGHLAGDRVLEEFVSKISSELRSGDAGVVPGEGGQEIGRFGGEEFLAVLPGADLDGAQRFAERVRKKVAETRFRVDQETTVKITLSAGVAEWQTGEDLEGLLRRADIALYEAKEAGRNRVRLAPTDPGVVG